MLSTLSSIVVLFTICSFENSIINSEGFSTCLYHTYHMSPQTDLVFAVKLNFWTREEKIFNKAVSLKNKFLKDYYRYHSTGLQSFCTSQRR